MRVLIIDDQPASVLALEQDLRDAGNLVSVVDFDQTEAALIEHLPDLVVLDLDVKDHGADHGDGAAGKSVYDQLIWERHFCPVVIYSAFADLFPVDDIPLVAAVAKGGGSEAAVMQAMEGLRPYAESVASLRGDVDEVARRTMRDLMQEIAKADGVDEGSKKDLAVEMGRRQVAAYLDDRQPAAALMPESQYVFPASGNAYRFADLLRVKGASPDDAAAYRLVLSPSCDMQHQGANQPRLGQVLAARCVAIPWNTRGLPPKPTTAAGWTKFSARLQEGAHNGLVFLPKLLEIVPAMCADLKNLTLLETYRLDADAGVCAVDTFDRVVSVDSPFRERIAWCYMSTAVRPGIPQINLSSWADMYK